MKMGAGIFWGVLLIVAGIALVIRVVFNVEFPVFRIILAVLLIFMGVRLLVGGSWFSYSSGDQDVIFGERKYMITGQEEKAEFNVIFGSGIYDFREVDLSSGSRRYKIGTIFGGSNIILSKDMPVRVHADAVFAGAELPDNNTAVFGSTSYSHGTPSDTANLLEIKVDVIFGGARVRMK